MEICSLVAHPEDILRSYIVVLGRRGAGGGSHVQAADVALMVCTFECSGAERELQYRA